MSKYEFPSITKELEKIRQEIGADACGIYPPLPILPGEMGIDVDHWKDIEAMIGEHGFFVHKETNTVMFLYIRDHSPMESSDGPHERKKLHFVFCETLQDMKDAGRLKSRYRFTSRNTNLYHVDYAGGVTREETLFPCQHCLAIAHYMCFHHALSRDEKERILKAFDAKTALDLIGEYITIFYRFVATNELRDDSGPTGYSTDHRWISQSVRSAKNYTCEECGVNLSASGHHRLCDMHHKDGDKRNNRLDNLQCLCKLCHAKLHPHYQVDPYHGSMIETLRHGSHGAETHPRR